MNECKCYGSTDYKCNNCWDKLTAVIELLIDEIYDHTFDKGELNESEEKAWKSDKIIEYNAI